MRLRTVVGAIVCTVAYCSGAAKRKKYLGVGGLVDLG